MAKTSKLIVIALGGNALNSLEGRGSYFEQLKNAQKAAEEIAKATKKGYKTVITHGNGPQVGNILLQQEYSKDYVSPMPLSICGAQSQGQIGTILVEVLNNEFKKLKLKARAATLISHVLINPKDPAFKNPTKPIGPIYTPTEAQKLKKQGMALKKIQVAAYRRVVPSPLPLEILELDGIRAILKNNLIPVAVGGGGIPIIRKFNKFEPVDAVIDKDLVSEVLASQLKAGALIILTNIEKVALNFQKKNQKLLDRLSLAEAKQYLAEGHFPSGSMGPKIEAAIKFLEKGGEKVIIAHLGDLTLALEEKTGTIITQNVKTS